MWINWGRAMPSVEGQGQFEEASGRSPDLKRSVAARRFLSVDEFSASSGLSTSTVRRLIAAQRIPTFQPGGPRCRILIPEDMLNGTTQASPTAHPEVHSSSAKPPIPGPRPRWQRWNDDDQIACGANLES